jgi:dephospho-CoA kinase
MPEIVIAIAGHAKSGKTTLANALSIRMGFPIASFGDEVRNIAVERRLVEPGSREERRVLMMLGEQLVAEELEGFCLRVLRSAGWEPGRSVIVEGVRHAAVVRELRELVQPTPCRLVLVDTPAHIRDQRFVEEGIGGPLVRAIMDAHSTEREVPEEVTLLADLVVDGSAPPDAMADLVLEHIQDTAEAQA